MMNDYGYADDEDEEEDEEYGNPKKESTQPSDTDEKDAQL